MIYKSKGTHAQGMIDAEWVSNAYSLTHEEIVRAVHVGALKGCIDKQFGLLVGVEDTVVRWGWPSWVKVN